MLCCNGQSGEIIENLNSKKNICLTKGIIIHLSTVIQSAALYSVCAGNIRRGNMYALSRELCSPAAVAERNRETFSPVFVHLHKSFGGSGRTDNCDNDFTNKVDFLQCKYADNNGKLKSSIDMRLSDENRHDCLRII